MLAIQEWVQEKQPHPLIASFAPMIAAFASEIPEILQHQKKHRLLNHTFPQPDITLWSSFYTAPEHYLNPFLQMLAEALPFVQKLFELPSAAQGSIESNKSLINILQNEKEFSELHVFLEDLLKLSLSYMEDYFEDTDLAPKERSVFQSYFDNHKMGLAFLYLIAFPCLLLFKETPAKLYSKASNGDAKAVFRLLCLDPFMLNAPEINRELQNIRIQGKIRLFEKLLNAPMRPIKPKLTARTYKDSLAGLISLVAEKALEQPLTSVEIRDLFDAVAKDAESDPDTYDDSFPKSLEGFLKIIQRNSSKWEAFLYPDRKI